MKLIKGVVSLLIALAAVAYLHRQVYLPFRCNQQKKLFEKAAVNAANYADRVQMSRIVRGHLGTLEHCLRLNQWDVELWVERAALLRLIGRREDAVTSYRRALAIERRPEIHVYLANTLVESGDRAGALEHYKAAARFSSTYRKAARQAGLGDELNEVLPQKKRRPWPGLRTRTDDSDSAGGDQGGPPRDPQRDSGMEQQHTEPRSETQ
ncbi:MAG TPA: hypothetical protein VM534_05315 [Thermoanaerobaculia bacterium]|nr:hypothetical protein [Thermoanaerobaculia bacterium]